MSESADLARRIQQLAAQAGVQPVESAATGSLYDEITALRRDFAETQALLEERIATIDEALDAVADRLESFARHGAQTTQERLADLDRDVASIGNRVDVAQEQLGALIAERIDEAFASLQIEEEVEESEVDEDALGELRDSVREALDGFAAAVERSLGSLGSTVSAALSDAAAGVADLPAQLQESDESLRTTLRDEADSQRAVVVEVGESVRATLAAELEGLRGSIESANVKIDQRFATLHDLPSRLQETAAELRSALEEATEAQRADVTDALGSVRSSISAELEVANARLERDSAQLAERFAALAAGLERQVGGLVEQINEQTAAMSEQVGDLTTALGDIREQLGAVQASNDEAIAELALLRRDWTTGAEQVVTQAKDAAEVTVDRVAAEIDARLSETTSTVKAATRTVHSVRDSLAVETERLATAGRGLLGYLAERDRALERERDRAVLEILEEFATGLSEKERRALAARVGDALARRRDSRDAARWRATQGKTEPDSAADLAGYAAADEPSESEGNASTAPEPSLSRPPAAPRAPAAPQPVNAPTQIKAPEPVSPAVRLRQVLDAEDVPESGPESAPEPASETRGRRLTWRRRSAGETSRDDEQLAPPPAPPPAPVAKKLSHPPAKTPGKKVAKEAAKKSVKKAPPPAKKAAKKAAPRTAKAAVPPEPTSELAAALAEARSKLAPPAKAAKKAPPRKVAKKAPPTAPGDGGRVEPPVATNARPPSRQLDTPPAPSAEPPAAPPG